MSPFLFRCPTTGRLVQALHADDEPAGETDEVSGRYISIECLACSGLHFVNPTTGRVLGDEDD
jgi:hypothetical protein